MDGITTNSIYQREYTMHDVLCASTELCERKDIKDKDGLNYFGNDYNIIGHEIAQISLNSQIADIDNVFFHNTYYQSLPYLMNAVRYIGDIGILVRMLGMDPIEFIELKNQLCTNEILKESWGVLYETSFIEPLGCSHTTEDNVDIPIEVKVLTLQIIYHIIKFCLIKIQKKNVQKYYIFNNSFKVLAFALGWKKRISVTRQPHKTLIARQQQERLITNIIQLAFHDTPFQDKIVVQFVNKKDINLSPNSVYISITNTVITAALPDIILLVHLIKRSEVNSSEFGKSRNIFNLREFLNIQLLPYKKKMRDDSGPTKYHLQSILFKIISNNNSQDVYRRILIDKNLKKYRPDTWYKEVLSDKFINLSDKGEGYLTIENLANHTDLYNQLVSIADADEFLTNIAVNHQEFFYKIFDDGIVEKTDIEEVKNDLLIAFASAHMADLLVRCGTFLTEDVFYAIFGITPTDNELKLLHRGLLLRYNLILYRKRIIPEESISTSRYDIHEIRMSHQVALELLCTYFSGLDKIIKIQTAKIRSLPTIAINTGTRPNKRNQLNCKMWKRKLEFINRVELVEHPLPLRVSFIDAIYQSTPVLLKLQKKLANHRYIGAEDIRLGKIINLDFDSFTEEDLKIFQYFTGYETVDQFEKWFDEILIDAGHDNLLYEILEFGKDKYTKRKYMFIIIILSTSSVDSTLLRREPYQFIKKDMRKEFPGINNDVFDKAHDYAQLISSFQQYKCRNITLSDVVHDILSGMYAKIISDDTVKFEVSSIKSGDQINKRYIGSSNILSADMCRTMGSYTIANDAELDEWYTGISDILSDKINCTVISQEDSKQTFNGRRLQLIPYTIAKIKSFESHNIKTDRVYYQKSYTLDIKEECMVTTATTQDMAIMSDQQSTSVRHNLKHKLPSTDSVPCKKTLSSSFTIDVTKNNNLVVATDNITQGQSTEYNQIQGNNISSNNDSSLLGMRSDNPGYSNHPGYNATEYNQIQSNNISSNNDSSLLGMIPDNPGYSNHPGYNATEYNQIQGNNISSNNDSSLLGIIPDNPGYNHPGYNQIQGNNLSSNNDSSLLGMIPDNPGYNQIQGNNISSNNDSSLLGMISDNPGYNHPGYNHPGYNHPGYNHPGYNHPGYNHPGYNHPGYNHPGYNHPGYNHPGYNHPGYNHPGYNHPGYNHPGYNHPGYNHPGYNHPGYNHPGYNHPGYNHPGYNHPGYNQIQGNNISSNNDSSLLGMISDNPGYNHPGYNHPGYNHPGYNHPGYNHPGYNQIQGNNISSNNDSSLLGMIPDNPGYNATEYNQIQSNNISSNNDSSLLGMIYATNQDDWMKIIGEFCE